MTCVSYFFAMFFKIILEFEEVWNQLDTDSMSENEKNNWFKSAYLDGYSEYYQSVTLLYFAFTSLATVGLGDYTPKSNVERLIIAATLLAGVLVFSYIIGDLKEVLDTNNKLHSFEDDNLNLHKFFGVLKKFNNNQQIE